MRPLASNCSPASLNNCQGVSNLSRLNCFRASLCYDVDAPRLKRRALSLVSENELADTTRVQGASGGGNVPFMLRTFLVLLCSSFPHIRRRKKCTATVRLRNWGKSRFRFPVYRQFSSSSTEGLHFFTRSFTQPPKVHSRAWANRILGVQWHIGASPCRYFHQLWGLPLSSATNPIALREIQLAQQIGAGSERERKFINALALIYQDADSVPYRSRVLNYTRAMGDLAAENRKDLESQIFYALALLASLSPTDKTHANQKQAADLLEPLYRANPEHPGIPHYLIHAYDNAELAPRGLVAARDYSKIAPSAPHALHMPSHIFTRLGLWDDSIASNLAARAAANQQGDTGEELHAMDYLVYAYLQNGRDADAAEIVQQLRNMPKLDAGDFKIGYASKRDPDSLRGYKEEPVGRGCEHRRPRRSLTRRYREYGLEYRGIGTSLA